MEGSQRTSHMKYAEVSPKLWQGDLVGCNNIDGVQPCEKDLVFESESTTQPRSAHQHERARERRMHWFGASVKTSPRSVLRSNAVVALIFVSRARKAGT